MISDLKQSFKACFERLVNQSFKDMPFDPQSYIPCGVQWLNDRGFGFRGVGSLTCNRIKYDDFNGLFIGVVRNEQTGNLKAVLCDADGIIFNGAEGDKVVYYYLIVNAI